MKQKCQRCGEEYLRRGHGQKFCSKFCGRQTYIDSRRQPPRDAKCQMCGGTFQTTRKNARACSDECRRLRSKLVDRDRAQDPEKRAMDRYDAALGNLERAKERFRLAREAAPSHVIAEVEGLARVIADRQETENREALENAANVTANRVRAFAEQPEVSAFLQEKLYSYCYMRGLTGYDRDAMWAQILGNPRPIVIADEAPEDIDHDPWGDL